MTPIGPETWRLRLDVRTSESNVDHVATEISIT